MRSDGREFSRDRCLVMVDGFYEFTTPSDPKQKRKDCWLFQPTEGDIAIAGIIRNKPDVGEAFTMLTVPPGPDIAPYHNRGVALLEPAAMARVARRFSEERRNARPGSRREPDGFVQALSFFHPPALEGPCRQS